MKLQYFEIPKRLLEYRKKLNINQEKMALQFGIKQEQYCRIENSTNVISYKSLKAFERFGGDVYYLITGKKEVVGKLDSYLEACRSIETRIDMMKQLLWLTKEGMILEKQDDFRQLDTSWKCVKLAELRNEKKSVWAKIRGFDHLTQKDMADRLDINVKRYQRIEDMKSEPDAEILLTLYLEFGYSPRVILDNQFFYLSDLNNIWRGFNDSRQEQFRHLLEEVIKITELYERE
jgi:transcriptional regulator with XRE-family HTH domain